MRIAILGTRGVPNNHGGFEQFAENFSIHLVKCGHDVHVYNSHNHPYKEKQFKGVNIIHCYDPEHIMGTPGQFIYDLNCIIDSRKKAFDVILQLGYTSSSIWHWLLPKKSVIVTNMDGLEWKRTKYNPLVKKYLKYAERLGAKYSDYLISDSIGIQQHILDEYNKESKYIPYGATIFSNPNSEVLVEYKINKYKFNMILARLEPENNIETIIRGYIISKTAFPLIIVGGLNKYGLGLKEKYKFDNRIKFVGPNYDQNALNNLRYYSRYYFHGHSVGGTNPSLLEAMASDSLIIAHNNIFNKSILRTEAIYFNSPGEIAKYLDDDNYFLLREENTAVNKTKILHEFTWDKINSEYEEYITKTTSTK